jgi:hypothetical protein
MLYSFRRLNTFRSIKSRVGSRRQESLDGTKMFKEAGTSTATVLNLTFFWGKFD